MRIGKMGVAVALTAALSVVGIATAVAGGSLSLAFRGGNTTTYPQPLKLVVTASEAVAESMTIDVRYAGDDWKTVRTISASRAAEATRFPVTINRPKANFEVRAVQGGVESAVATGGVKARMSAIALRRSAGENATVTVKGSLAPTHTVDDAIVTVRVYKLTTTKSAANRDRTRDKFWRGPKFRVSHELVDDYPGVVFKNSHGVSWWKADITLAEKGTYEVVAFHEDVEHLASSSKTARLKIK